MVLSCMRFLRIRIACSAISESAFDHIWSNKFFLWRQYVNLLEIVVGNSGWSDLMCSHKIGTTNVINDQPESLKIDLSMPCFLRNWKWVNKSDLSSQSPLNECNNQMKLEISRSSHRNCWIVLNAKQQKILCVGHHCNCWVVHRNCWIVSDGKQQKICVSHVGCHNNWWAL